MTPAEKLEMLTREGFIDGWQCRWDAGKGVEQGGSVVGVARDETLRATLREQPPDLSSFLATLRALPVALERLAVLLDGCGSCQELHRLCRWTLNPRHRILHHKL